MSFFPTEKKSLFFFFLRVIIVTIGLSFVFLGKIYADALAVDGPLILGFPFPACSISSGFGAPSVKTCSRSAQAADIALAFVASTVIMLLFRRLGGPPEDLKSSFPSSS